MFYQLLNSKAEAWEKCVSITKIIFLASNTAFSMLTFLYLKAVVEKLEDMDLSNAFSLFDELKECIIKSHICG